MDNNTTLEQLIGEIGNVPIDSLLTDSFISQYTSLDSVEALFKEMGISPHDVKKSAKEMIKELESNPTVNSIVSEKTQFSDFKELLKAAKKDYKKV